MSDFVLPLGLRDSKEAPSVFDDKLLTIVLPIRAKDEEFISRLEYILEDNKLDRQHVGILIIDDGSSEIYSRLINECGKRNNFAYYKIDSEHQDFSVGRCRNYAAMLSGSKYIMFQDVDLVPTPGFYNDVVKEIQAQGLEENAAKFLMFGVIYLTRLATDLFFDTERDIRRSIFTQQYLEANANIIEKFSTGTSVNLYNREYYLSKGGNDDDFEGWGFEDLEFNTRCIRALRYFPLPEDWLLDYKNFSTISSYKGWKSIYRLFGDMTFAKGMVLFHAWHEVEVLSDYMTRKNQNKKIFIEKMSNFAKFDIQPSPLPNFRYGKTLCFRNNAFVNARDISPFLGYVYLRNEEEFTDSQDFLHFLKEKDIDRVLFHNPYCNAKMLSLYTFCRDNKVPYFVSERGALPNSIFFDPNGFNYDSISYSSVFWDKEISDEERRTTLDYMNSVKSGNDFLELQADRLYKDKLRKKLNIHSSKKVLFVAFQRPEDTVITHFSHEGSFKDFSYIVNNIANRLGRDWVVVTKKHPLEDEIYSLENTISANDENIYDLIDLSDAVFVINSGCGVLSLLWEKPVFCLGNAFYCHNGLANKVSSLESLYEALMTCEKPDKIKILRFISYLINDFYSFGEMKTRSTLMPITNKRMTATTDIKYTVIRGISKKEYCIRRYSTPKMGKNSPLFDRYRGSNYSSEGELSELLGNNNNQVNKVKEISFIQNAGLDSNTQVSLARKRLNKFRRTPILYMIDSKHYLLRSLGKTVKKITQLRKG